MEILIYLNLKKNEFDFYKYLKCNYKYLLKHFLNKKFVRKIIYYSIYYIIIIYKLCIYKLLYNICYYT